MNTVNIKYAAALLCAVLSWNPAVAQTAAQTPPPPARPKRQPPPTRDPLAPGFVTAKELPDGAVPPADAEGNFIIGPTHQRGAGNGPAGRRAEGPGL